MSKRSSLALFCALGTMAVSGPSDAAELSSAEGPVVLTIAGEIENTNRPAFDAFKDPFINYHERPFEKAAEFDASMLEALGMHEFEVNYEDWPEPVTLAGPRLADLLDAVGADPETMMVLALDGFAVDLSAEVLESEDWIVAIKQNGAYMGLGQRGPAWVAFDPGDDKTITPEEEGSWPWAAFFIEIK